jgi:hypothetical protein
MVEAPAESEKLPPVALNATEVETCEYKDNFAPANTVAVWAVLYEESFARIPNDFASPSPSPRVDEVATAAEPELLVAIAKNMEASTGPVVTGALVPPTSGWVPDDTVTVMLPIRVPCKGSTLSGVVAAVPGCAAIYSEIT